MNWDSARKTPYFFWPKAGSMSTPNGSWPQGLKGSWFSTPEGGRKEQGFIEKEEPWQPALLSSSSSGSAILAQILAGGGTVL